MLPVRRRPTGSYPARTVTYLLLFTPWLITPLISHGQISLWEQSICPRLHSVPVGSKQAPLALRTRRQFNMGICGYVHRVPVNSNTYSPVNSRLPKLSSVVFPKPPERIGGFSEKSFSQILSVLLYRLRLYDHSPRAIQV